MTLITAPNLANPDLVYERLVAMHDGKSERESLRRNARLILLLVNHIGDEDAVLEAIALASSEAVSGETCP